ncbi:MAG: lactate racemase domain-containing protein [Spirochaetia bacterium]
MNVSFIPDKAITGITQELTEFISQCLSHIKNTSRCAVVPPDFTRRHSFSGEIVSVVYSQLKGRLKAVIPATGTHRPMELPEKLNMYPDIPENLFCEHDWKRDCRTFGEISVKELRELTDMPADAPWKIDLNKHVFSHDYDCILSIGQVIPHEVVGMSNHSKNLVIGLGGRESIHQSHYIGAIAGVEDTIGKTDTPVRRILEKASEKFLQMYNTWYFLSVCSYTDNTPCLEGLFFGNDYDCFKKAAELSGKVNIYPLEKKAQRVVVNLSSKKYKSTWIGNKAIYRSRLITADKGEIIVFAPGVDRFGEDPEIDRLIRKYGYCGTNSVKHAVKKDQSLRNNLAAAAHLIHGSSEDRFTVSYAVQKSFMNAVSMVKYQPLELNEALQFVKISEETSGWKIDSEGNNFYYIQDPGAGLWTHR